MSSLTSDSLAGLKYNADEHAVRSRVADSIAAQDGVRYRSNENIIIDLDLEAGFTVTLPGQQQPTLINQETIKERLIDITATTDCEGGGRIRFGGWKSNRAGGKELYGFRWFKEVLLGLALWPTHFLPTASSKASAAAAAAGASSNDSVSNSAARGTSSSRPSSSSGFPLKLGRDAHDPQVRCNQVGSLKVGSLKEIFIVVCSQPSARADLCEHCGSSMSIASA